MARQSKQERQQAEQLYWLGMDLKGLEPEELREWYWIMQNARKELKQGTKLWIAISRLRVLALEELAARGLELELEPSPAGLVPAPDPEAQREPRRPLELYPEPPRPSLAVALSLELLGAVHEVQTAPRASKRWGRAHVKALELSQDQGHFGLVLLIPDNEEGSNA